MNAERTREPSDVLRELRAARAATVGAGRIDAQGEIAEIEAAVARLANGTYGMCVACGNSIAPDRLELLPATPYCLGCATEHMHDPGHPTVTSGLLGSDQVRFVTDTELGPLLSLGRRNRMRALGEAGGARCANA